MANDTANVAPFELRLEGETTGTLWYGNFKAKQRLSLRDQLNRDKVRRELLGAGGGVPDDRALSIAVIVSELAVRITDAPDWWKEMGNGLEMEDGNIVSKIYDEVMKIEADAQAERKKKAEEARDEMKKTQSKLAEESALPK